MTSATVAVVGLADPLADDDVARLVPPPIAGLPGGAVLAFPTATSAARALQDLRARRPFIRAAVELSEAPLDGARPLLGGLAAVTRALDRAANAQQGEVLVSDLARGLLTVSSDLRCEPCAAGDGVHRLVPVEGPRQPLPLPRAFATADRHPFVNRYAPWLALERGWAAVTAGERRVVLLEGEAGSGKTRLVAEFARRAHIAGGIVAYGGSTEAVELPFQPFNEALRPAFEELVDRSPGAPLGDGVRADLALLFPWAAAAGSSNGGAGTGRRALPRGPETDRHWAFEAVVDLLVTLTTTAPVLVVLDDLHWARRPTLRLLEHVVRSPRLERLCIVATARDAPTDRTDAFARAFPNIARLHGVERVDLEPFDEAGVRRFVASATGMLPESLPGALEAVVRQLTELSAGNAFFLTETWRQLLDDRHVRRDDGRWSFGPAQAGETPRSVREMVGQRLARLGGRSRRVLQLAACSGVSLEVQVIARAAGIGIDHVLDAVAEATAAGLLRDLGAGRATFVHALVRRSIEGSLPASERARCHLALATALRDAGNTEPAVLAHHFTAAVPLEPPSTAVHHARLAARRSIETVSFDDAIAVLHDVAVVVADDGDRADILVDLATAYARAGDSVAAVRCCQDAAELARTLGDQARLVGAARVMSEATWRGALDGRPAVALLREALADEDEPATRCELLGALSAALALSGADRASWAAAGEATSLATSLGRSDLLLDAIHSGLFATVTPENVEDQLAFSRRGLELAVREGDGFAELRLICKVMVRLFVQMDSASLARLHHRQGVLVRRFRQPLFLLVHAGMEAAMALCEGRFADAETASEDVRRWAEINHQDDGAYGIEMFSIRREQGRLAELRPVLELAARLGGDAAWAPGLAAVHAEAGMTREASALLDRLAAEHLASLPDDSLAPAVLSYLADAAFECGHREMAQQVLPRLEPYHGLAVCVPGLVCYGAADRYLGRLHSTLGKHDAAVAAFEAALELDQRAGWPTWTAHSQLALAGELAVVARHEHLAQATELARAAGATAASLGMSALSRRADALLDALHATPPEAGGSLTPRESEVLRLLCRGRSNRQIGEDLHASPHTIANHVRAILAKTGTANRTEAATWAHHHGVG